MREAQAFRFACRFTTGPQNRGAWAVGNSVGRLGQTPGQCAGPSASSLRFAVNPTGPQNRGAWELCGAFGSNAMPMGSPKGQGREEFL